MNTGVTYGQKIVLAIIFGFIAAGAVKFYDVFVVSASESVNGGYNNRTTLPASPP